MSNLFAYGTLMCEDILAEVAGLHRSPVPGTLRGYRRVCVKGELYPALVPDPEGAVEGVVYRDIPPPAWERLDRFEAELYTREAVRVELRDGAVTAAETYVARAAFQDALEEVDWDFEDFLREGKARFLAGGME